MQGNVRNDDFVEIWKNKFKWFRNLDKLKCKECENCKDWKYCRGDSLDTNAVIQGGTVYENKTTKTDRKVFKRRIWKR